MLLDWGGGGGGEGWVGGGRRGRRREEGSEVSQGRLPHGRVVVSVSQLLASLPSGLMFGFSFLLLLLLSCTRCSCNMQVSQLSSSSFHAVFTDLHDASESRPVRLPPDFLYLLFMSSCMMPPPPPSLFLLRQLMGVIINRLCL